MHSRISRILHAMTRTSLRRIIIPFSVFSPELAATAAACSLRGPVLLSSFGSRYDMHACELRQLICWVCDLAMPRSGASGRSLRTLPACAAGCWPPCAGARALYPVTDEYESDPYPDTLCVFIHFSGDHFSPAPRASDSCNLLLPPFRLPLRLAPPAVLPRYGRALPPGAALCAAGVGAAGAAGAPGAAAGVAGVAGVAGASQTSHC